MIFEFTVKIRLCLEVPSKHVTNSIRNILPNFAAVTWYTKLLNVLVMKTPTLLNIFSRTMVNNFYLFGFRYSQIFLKQQISNILNQSFLKLGRLTINEYAFSLKYFTGIFILFYLYNLGVSINHF